MRTALREAHAIDHIIKPGLEHLQQVFASLAASLDSHAVVAAELPLTDAVNAASLLLPSQLTLVIRNAAPSELCHAAMLARRIASLLKGTFRREAALSFEKQFLAFAAAEFTDWSRVLRHTNGLPSLS
jgi:hypothetical protein